jgi:hypothetical protein
MAHDVLLLLAGGALVFLGILALSSRGHPHWVEHVRDRVRAHDAAPVAASNIEEPVRHSPEATEIETAWEHERSRAALQEAKPEDLSLRRR